MVKRYIDSRWGYAWVRVKDHEVFKDGWVREHHLVWWKKHRTTVPRGCVLHHRNEVKTDNRLSNLQLLTRAEHARLHSKPHSEETKSRMKVSAKLKCTEEWRAAVSKRVKDQHSNGKFGRSTWTKESEESFKEKMSAATKGKPHPRPAGWICSEESRERYRQAAIKREAKKSEKRH